MIKQAKFLSSLVLVISTFIVLSACSDSDKANESKLLFVDKSVTVNVPVAEVWEIAGAFDGLHKWHPAATASVMSNEGKTRLLTLVDGAKVVENLVKQTDDSYTYEIVEGSLPVVSYKSTISVKSISDNETKVTWSSAFSADGVSNEDAINAIASVYDSGLNNLATLF